MNRNLIALRHGFVQLVERTKPSPALEVAFSLQAELMKLGYMLDRAAFDEIEMQPLSNVVHIHDQTLAYLRNQLGADRKYAPMYPNFPTEVMEATSMQLYINAMTHYWSNGTWSPSSELKVRGVKFEHTKFQMLQAVRGDDWLKTIGYELAAFTRPLDGQRVEELVWIAKNVPGFMLPKITVRETLCRLAAEGLDIKISSVTDVLRIATHLSGGDIALPSIPKTKMSCGVHARAKRWAAHLDNVDADRAKFKFKKFKRAERKQLLNLLENLPRVEASEMQPYLGRWLRLGEILHPGEFATKYPKAFAAFNAIRNQKVVKVRTFAGEVDLAFKKSFGDGLLILKTRPGEFARRLDSLLRQAEEIKSDKAINLVDFAYTGVHVPVFNVLTSFAEIAEKVSAKVLFEMFDHFENRRVDGTRSVMIKGKGSKMAVLEPLKALPKTVIYTVQQVIKSALSAKMKALPSMEGRTIYLDPGLKNIPVPYSMQASSEGAKTLVRVTRTAFNENAHTLRAFVHWYDEYGSIDIDLAAQMLSEDFVGKGDITFYELRNTKIGACHSGDVRHKKGDCAEYIDIPIEAARNAGVRYVMFTAYNYNGTSMESVQGTTFGVMEREKPKSNEIFDPKTIANAIKLQGKTSSTTPVVFDLVKNNWIWLDLEHDNERYASLLSDDISLKQLKAILNGTKLSVLELITMHIEARGGKLVESEAEAEGIFLVEHASDYSKLTPFLDI